ncbi:hypothetical protein LWI28_001615 [Acer negundo]|uniref:Uncharacterized protein n=1 Tax=Acer negundo TaxID=4023 RepID=A0AAD5P0R7_ACENE|nr:hypothetical protein LWI28_001615 [Acer negundo]KAK4850296.1 hypothetical protein QYF36_005412 [Acer negundo]
MTSGSNRCMPQLGSRDILIWFFILISTLYILYSSNLLLNNDNQDCKKRHGARFSKEEETNIISSVLNNSSSSSINNHLRLHETHAEENNDEEEEETIMPPQNLQGHDTTLKHIVFGIAASSNLWNKRKEYIKSWWRSKEMRGVVWTDTPVRVYRNEELPQIRVSGDTSKFKYSNRQGSRSALRISRVVSETLRLGLKDVRWFVMGDDDTVFMVDNVLRVLNKYDHRQFYYLGSSSESHVQNILFSYAMAYGGGGFAISYPLAMELEKMQDRCIQRYPGLYGSDDRIQACMTELGVPLTKEAGFHQCDLYGNLFGLLSAHPIAPLLSIHHLDLLEPIFPDLDRVEAVRHFLESVKLDSASIIQQSICYDNSKFWSISVSWGYVVQIFRNVVSPRELERPTRTFLNWYPRADYKAYSFNTRPVPKNPCQKPFIFYMEMVRFHKASNLTVGFYTRRQFHNPFCRWKVESPEKIETVVVFKRPEPHRWQKSPRRDCCRVLPSKNSSMMYIWVDNCVGDEKSELLAKHAST